MTPPTEVVGDPTDPQGTQRPNLPPEEQEGTQFEPLFCPDSDSAVLLPSGIRPRNAFAIWSLFFTLWQGSYLAEDLHRSLY